MIIIKPLYTYIQLNLVHYDPKAFVVSRTKLGVFKQPDYIFIYVQETLRFQFLEYYRNNISNGPKLMSIDLVYAGNLRQYVLTIDRNRLHSEFPASYYQEVLDIINRFNELSRKPTVFFESVDLKTIRADSSIFRARDSEFKYRVNGLTTIYPPTMV